jgi:WD40 repeat protein
VGDRRFSGDGRVLLTSNWEDLYLWDVSTGKRIRKREGEGSQLRQALALSRNGKVWGVATFDSSVDVSDDEGRKLGRCSGDAKRYPFALSPDGTTLATGGSKGLLLWALPHKDE